MPRMIVFASDFGAATEWVGVCHAVMAGIAPESRVVDLAHELPRLDVTGAGLVLRDALEFTPSCVAALVVDPGVGTERRAIGVATGRGDVLVGPDNGLLPRAAERIGGVASARALTNSALHLRAASSTFHARDIFCPVAAHLSAGVAFNEVGLEIDVASLVTAPPALLEINDGIVTCEATNVDGFGNVRLSASPESLVAAHLGDDVLWVQSSDGEISVHRAQTFGALEPGQFGLIVDSFGWLSLCVNRGSAAEELGVARGARLELRAQP